MKNISSVYFKSIIYLFIFSAIVGCRGDDDLDPKSDCSKVEVNILCDRPSIAEVDHVFTILESYTSSGIQILNKYLDGCFEADEDKVKTIKSYLSIPGNGGSRIDTIISLNVVVHELTHALGGRYSSESASYCESQEMSKMWIDDQVEIEMSVTELFPAKEIGSSLIQEASNTLYTSQYIESEQHASQSLGVYTLVDEFNAYFQGLNTVLELFPAYNELYEKSMDISILENFVIQIENEIPAYFVFKYYILLYVDYAKMNHPKYYEKLKGNEKFWKVYNAVDGKFASLIVEYKNLLSNNSTLEASSNLSDLYDEMLNAIEEEIKKLE